MWSVVWCCGVLQMILAAVIHQPPSIREEPPNNVYFKVGETVQLVCKAKGGPAPTFNWRRNEIAFNPSGNDDRIVQLSREGTLVFNRPENKDEGIFQCFARNEYGVSVSRKINFRQAKLESFINSPASRHTPALGTAYTLPCVPPESVPPAGVFWVTKTPAGGIEAVAYDSRVTMDREYRLRFANIQQTDAKNDMPYLCVAMNSIMRRNVMGPLHFIKPSGGKEEFMPVEHFWSDQDDRFGLKGQVFNIKCIFSGNPTPDIYWERTDNKSFSSRVQLKSFARELEITDLQFEDAGTYECWASNSISRGRKIRNFRVRVNSQPYFIQEPQDIETGVGASVEVTCLAGGVPGPDIEWYINGVALKEVTDPRINGRLKRDRESKIVLNNLEETDNMVMQCNASNIHGYAFADFFIQVKSEAPTIIQPPANVQYSAESYSVILTCRTTGKPDPTISWFKDTDRITGGRYLTLKNGDLFIKSVVLSDAGRYRCHAENRYNQTYAEGTLIVRRKTRIEQEPFDLEVMAGKDAKFTCSATTDPEEVVHLRMLWMKDGKPITANDQRMTTNRQDNSLTISGTIMRDSGTYTCIATNGLDNSTASAVLIVKDIPESPSNVRLEFCNENATVRWMPGSINNSPIQYFVLQYNTSFNPNQWSFGAKVGALVSRVNMTLSPFVNYTFRVIAYNKIGPSVPSFPTSNICSTKPARPLFSPRNLRTVGHRVGKLYIEWTPMPQIVQNGPGFYYTLQVRRVGSENSSQLQSYTINDWRRSSFEISTGLVYEPFQITLRAGNSVGEATQPPSTIIGYSYESVPTITPTNFEVEQVNDSYAIFKWDFDTNELQKQNSRLRGMFRGFKIQFWEQGQRVLTVREQNIGPESALNTGNTFTARVDHLQPNTNMEARISVMNNYFIGPPTESLKFRTESGFPGPVEYLRPINIGDTHVNLEWGSPLENRGDLEGYDITYQIVINLYLGGMQERLPSISDPATSNAHLSGLLPSSKYRIHIFARTAKGRGEGYFIEVTTTSPGTPMMPRFNIASVGRNDINVTWWINPHASSGTVVYVEWRKLDGPEWIRSMDEVINSWKKIDNLQPGTTYEIRILVTNGVTSKTSGIEEVRTQGIAMATSLAGSISWFVGMMVSVLALIGLILILIICWKRGFMFSHKDSYSYCGVRLAPKPISDTYASTTYMAKQEKSTEDAVGQEEYEDHYPGHLDNLDHCPEQLDTDHYGGQEMDEDPYDRAAECSPYDTHVRSRTRGHGDHFDGQVVYDKDGGYSNYDEDAGYSNYAPHN
ncbi:neuroglian-like isoform X2 [Physella acuta]|nr:neuroglian-like isoform X2 [Physella acuta]XP_059166691.1 neuroglian-like isoform X2 [Physella acuta]